MDSRLPQRMVTGVATTERAEPSTDAPSLYGYRVHSNVNFRFMRVGGGADSLELTVAGAPAQRPMRQPIADWQLHGTAYPAQATLYKSDDGGFEFWTTDTGRFVIDPARGWIELPAMSDDVLREQRLCGIPMILTYASRGDFSLHAAAVNLPGGAVILAGPSGFGKSTLSLAFHSHGYRVLSEDLVCCRPGTLSVLPGPALVRVRPDMFDGTVPTGTHVEVTRPDRIYLGIDPERRGSSAPVPLVGIVFLRESDQLGMEPVPPQGVIPDLWALNFRLPTGEDRSRSFRQITTLASGVRCWNLHRPLRIENLVDTVEIVARTLGQ